ncbi:MAG: hypothetical protein KDA24_27175 [Deltaproteobacteria bacterium]|nr:hypothetical protein [Deltaproteobacteria bacterium]
MNLTPKVRRAPKLLLNLLIALVAVLFAVPALAGPNIVAHPPGWIPAPPPAEGELVLAPSDEQALQNYVQAQLGSDPVTNLAAYFGDLGVTRWWWEDNFELTTWLKPGGSANRMEGFFSLVETNAQVGVGCLFQLGHFPDFDCTAELPAPDLAAMAPSLSMTLVRTPEQFVDEVWPLAWDGAWWQGVPGTQTGSSRWATSCVDLRMASPASSLAGIAGATTAVAGYARAISATSAAATIKATLVGWIGGKGVAAGFIAAGTGVTTAATVGTVAVIVVVGGVVAYTGYKTAQAVYASTFTYACPGCLEMQTDEYRCQVVNDTCDCWETTADYPYGPGDTGAEPDREEEDRLDPVDDVGPPWEEIPGAGCAEWVTHSGSYCEGPCQEIAEEEQEIYGTEDEDPGQYEWTSCMECAVGSFGFQGMITGCVGNLVEGE